MPPENIHRDVWSLIDTKVSHLHAELRALVTQHGVHTPVEHIAVCRLATRVLHWAGLGAVRTCATRFLFRTDTVAARSLRPEEWLALVTATVAALRHASCCFAPPFVTVEFRPAQRTLWLLHPVHNTVRLSAACMYDAATLERAVVQACACCFCWQGIFFESRALARCRHAVLTTKHLTDADVAEACCLSLEQLERKAARVLGVDAFSREESVPDEEYAAVLGALVLHRSQCFRGKLAGLRVTVAKDAAHAERKGGTVTIPADAPSVPAHFDALLTMVSG